MEKSKVIEKLFEHINTYAYLILPFLFVITGTKKRDGVILAVYGIVLWAMLFFYYDIPKAFIKTAYQPLYTSLEYSFFTSLFYFNFKSQKFKRAVIAFSVLFIVFQFIYIYFMEKQRVDSIPIGIESILIFVYIFFYFYENFQTSKNIYSNHCFWISIGLLFYLGGSFFLNILANTFTNEEFKKYWFLNFIADTFKTMLFGVAFIFLVRIKTNISNTKQDPNNIPFLDMI